MWPTAFFKQKSHYNSASCPLKKVISHRFDIKTSHLHEFSKKQTRLIPDIRPSVRQEWEVEGNASQQADNNWKITACVTLIGYLRSELCVCVIFSTLPKDINAFIVGRSGFIAALLKRVAEVKQQQNKALFA